jgi:hypothetical protein
VTVGLRFEGRSRPSIGQGWDDTFTDEFDLFHDGGCLHAAEVDRKPDSGNSQQVARVTDAVDDLIDAADEGDRVEQRHVA